MFLCAETTTGIKYIFSLVQHLSMFCHGNISTVFNGAVEWKFSAGFKLVAHRFLSAVCLATQAQNFSETKFFLEDSRLPFIMFFVFSTTHPEKQFFASAISGRFFTVFAVWQFLILASPHFVYTHTLLFRQKLKTLNLLPFPSPHSYQHRIIMFKKL